MLLLCRLLVPLVWTKKRRMALTTLLHFRVTNTCYTHWHGVVCCAHVISMGMVCCAPVLNYIYPWLQSHSHACSLSLAAVSFPCLFMLVLVLSTAGILSLLTLDDKLFLCHCYVYLVAFQCLPPCVSGQQIPVELTNKQLFTIPWNSVTLTINTKKRIVGIFKGNHLMGSASWYATYWNCRLLLTWLLTSGCRLICMHGWMCLSLCTQQCSQWCHGLCLGKRGVVFAI